MIYDDTCRTSAVGPGRIGVGLTHSWIAGARLYRWRGALDDARPARSWDEALHALVDMADGRRIQEVQIWAHGKWGDARMAQDVFDGRCLLRDHPLRHVLDDIEALVDEQSLWWFRTCETIGAHVGHAFAEHLSCRLGCRVAGHTHIIGPWQSGLHSLAPGDVPHWDVDEGLVEGTARDPRRAAWSTASAPHTIHCMQSQIPQGW